jgi:Zn-dependent protease with chaperone function
MTNIAVAGLVAIHSILIIAAGWYGMTVLLERISLKMLLVLGLIGLGALIGAFQIVSSLRGRFRKASAAVVGKAVSQQDAPNLWNEVKALSAAAGTAPPSHLVVGLDPNFFVTEADVRCVEANLTGRTMYLSLPLCRILSVEELRAVVSHELGHFHGADTEFSLHFYPIYRGAVDSYDAAASVAYDSEGSVNWALLPALAVLGHFLRSFSSAESRISRDRELLADRFAAELVSEDAVASALVKIHAYSDYWDAVIEMMRQSLQEGSISIGGQTYDVERFFANLSLLFATVASSFTSSISLDSLGEHRIPHPTDSHPPLTVRLEALNRTVEHVAQNALDVTPADAAITLIDGHEKLETALSALQKLIVHPQLAEQQLAAS